MNYGCACGLRQARSAYSLGLTPHQYDTWGALRDEERQIGGQRSNTSL